VFGALGAAPVAVGAVLASIAPGALADADRTQLRRLLTKRSLDA
jgi:hypothetical protein